MSNNAKSVLLCATILVALATSSAVQARRGADDAPDDVRQCRGCDDPAGHIR